MTLRSRVHAQIRHRVGPLMRSRWLRAACAVGIERSVKIMMGHYFGVPRPYVFARPKMAIDDLQRALAILSQHFEFVSLERIIEDCGRPPARSRRLAVTFDDGFDLLREGAYDVFDAFKVPVTTFMTLESIDNRDLIWPNKLHAIEVAKGFSTYRAKLGELQERHSLPIRFAQARSIYVSVLGWPAARKDALANELWKSCDMPPLDEYLDEHRPFYSRDDLHELLRRGHGIGLHSRSHPYCDTLTDAEVEDEFVQPATWMRQHLGLRAVPMAYPFGVRLAPAQERRLEADGVVSCALGIGGFSRMPAGPFQLRRMSLEGDVAYKVFAAPLVERLRPGSRTGAESEVN